MISSLLRAAGCVTLLAGALSLPGCESTTEPSDIMGGTWRLASVTPAGGNAQTPTDASRYTMNFGVSGQLAVRADCNTCGGQYDLNASTLTVSQLACTLIACAAPSLDQPFLAVLSGTTSVRLNAGQDELTLTGTRGTLTLRR